MRLLARLGTTPLDAGLAVAFAVAGLVQVVAVPIADRGLGELFVLGTTLPLAWRRTRPVEAALVASAFWLVPLDGFPVLGFVVVILQFFSLGGYGEPTRAVAVTTVWAAAASVVGTLLGPEASVAAVGGVLVVVAPVLAGRLVRHLRRQNAELTSLTEQLREERSRGDPHDRPSHAGRDPGGPRRALPRGRRRSRRRGRAGRAHRTRSRGWHGHHAHGERLAAARPRRGVARRAPDRARVPDQR